MDKLTLVTGFSAILNTQNAFNKKVNPDWLDADCLWHTAVWTECGEAMSYLNWPWWKARRDELFASPSDRVQFFLELVDIFCFGVSLEWNQAYQSGADDCDSIVYTLANFLTNSVEKLPADQRTSPSVLVERIAEAALAEHRFASRPFFVLVNEVGLGVDGLMLYFYGKDTLSHFRQEHGYKAGTYRKNWGTTAAPEEDNVHLADIIENYRKMFGEDLIHRIKDGHFVNYVRTNLAMTFNNLEPLT